MPGISQPGWRRINVCVSMPLPSRVNVVHVTTDIAGKTPSADDGYVLFQTQVWHYCHSEEACITRNINKFSTEHQPRSAIGESTKAVSSSGSQQSSRESFFKVGVFGYKAIHGLTPPYLKKLFVPVSSVPALSRNRSASRGDFIVPPGTRNITYRQRSFAVAGPTWWNYFPLGIRNSSSMQTFHSRLKTFLFREACNISAS